MQHLTAEALARLVDEPPDRAEAAHLESCSECREELEALGRQTTALAALGQAQPAEPPPEHWDAIVARLSASVAAAPLDELAVRRRARLLRTPWFRVAAAVAIYALGTGTGLGLRARGASDGSGQSSVAAVTSSPATSPTNTTAAAAPSTTVASAGPTGESTGASESARPSAEAPTQTGRLTADDGTRRYRLRPLADPSQAATAEEALQLMNEYEQGYAEAYTRLAELRQQQAPDDPVARIAALESIVLTTRQALDRAPADPVINGYHLNAVAQRDAALRQAALRSNGGRWF